MTQQMDLHHRPSKEKLQTESIMVNFGPQHPSTHGVLFVQIELDGEVVVDAIPHIGYLHRCMEKLAENRTWSQVIPYLDRCDYMSGIINEMAYVLAVEKLIEVDIPERADHIRVAMCELTRVASHLLFFGAYGLDLGAITPFFYAFREREKVLDIIEMVSGYRMTPNYLRFGGVKEDVPPGFEEAVYAFCEEFPARVDEYEELLTGNEIFMVRTQGLKTLTPERAVNWGVTGPLLRATGVNWDLRRDDPYSIYHKFNFEVPVEEHGDCFDAYKIRVREMREAAKIAKQAVETMPSGPIRAKLPREIRPPKGEAYARVEGPRGELGIYVVSDGGPRPYRFRMRAPSFVNLEPLAEMIRGWKVADAIAFIGILDIVLGEVDR